MSEELKRIEELLGKWKKLQKYVDFRVRRMGEFLELAQAGDRGPFIIEMYEREHQKLWEELWAGLPESVKKDGFPEPPEWDKDRPVWTFEQIRGLTQCEDWTDEEVQVFVDSLNDPWKPNPRFKLVDFPRDTVGYRFFSQQKPRL